MSVSLDLTDGSKACREKGRDGLYMVLYAPWQVLALCAAEELPMACDLLDSFCFQMVVFPGGSLQEPQCTANIQSVLERDLIFVCLFVCLFFCLLPYQPVV